MTLYEHNIVCEFCLTEITKINTNKQTPRFCNRSCSNAWQHANGIRRAFFVDKSTREWKVLKYGEASVCAKEIAKKLSLICETQCKNCNKKFTKPIKLRKFFCCRSCANQFSYLNGKKLPSNLGNKHSEETKEKMRQSAARRLKQNPESFVGWKTIKGWYKGKFFRSSYEYFFLKKLESDGFNIDRDVEYETLKVPYYYDGKLRQYVIDFYIPSKNKAYEIKNSYSANLPIVKAKKLAAESQLEKQNIKYELLTESSIPMPPARQRLPVMSLDQCVFLLPNKLSQNDRLSQIFQEQQKFMNLLIEKRNFPNFPVDLSSKSGQKLIKEISYNCMQELFESIQLLTDSKSHRMSIVGDFNREKYIEELCDSFHYFIEICLVSGVTQDELYKAYMKKGTVNFARIFENY